MKMTGKEKLKLGLGLGAAIGAGAVVNEMLMPKAMELRGGWIMKILGFLGVTALTGIAIDAANKQTEELVETFSGVPAMVREIKELSKKT